MNKLVSRTLVQRFKEGKKIIKALEGTQFGRNIQYVYYTGRDGIARQAMYNPQAKRWMYANRNQKNWNFMPEGYVTHDGYNFIGDFAAVSNQKNKEGVQKKYIQKLANKQSNKTASQNKTPSNKNNSSSNFKPSIPTKSSDKVKPSSSESKVVAGGSSKGNMFINQSKNTTPVNNIWVKGFNRRPEITDVRAIQNKLIQLGLLNDRFGDDGRWGRNTEEAYKKYLALNSINTNPDDFAVTKPIDKVIIPNVPQNISPGYLVDENPLQNYPTTRYATTFMKKGGQLPSRNPIERFKNRK